MVNIIKSCPERLGSRMKTLDRWRIHPETKAEIKRFIDDLALGKVNRGRRISERRQTKYLDILKPALEFLDKPTSEITEKEVEAFERDLVADKIRSTQRNKPYALNTKSDIRKGLRTFLRWRLGPAEALRLTGWLDTRDRFKTSEYMREAEIERLYRKCTTAEQRYAVAVLFDSGARAQEFLNIRLEDIQMPAGTENFVRIALKEEYSKTKGRTIALYWRHSVEAVREYLEERMASGPCPHDPVFAGRYDGMRMFLSRLGRRILRRRVHPHLFRHSSATYYATRLNRQELCYRYGWRFSSNMPDVYISRSGMETHQLDAKFTQTELSTLKEDFVRVNQDNQIKSQRIEELQNSIETMKRSVELITQILESNPQLEQVINAIQQKRQKIG